MTIKNLPIKRHHHHHDSMDCIAAIEQNLLALQRPAQEGRKIAHWIILIALILVHGGLLAYLVGFVRLPDQGGTDLMASAIQIEIASDESREALEKRDQEQSGFSARRPAYPVHGARTGVPAILHKPAAAKRLKFYQPAGALPEDAGLRLIEDRVVTVKAAESRSQSSPLPAPLSLHHAAGVAHPAEIGPKPRSLNSKRRMGAAQLWSEDSGRALAGKLTVHHSPVSAEPTDQLTSSGSLPSIAATAALIMPLPRRRVAGRAEIVRHDVSRLSHSGSKNDDDPPPEERRSFGNYRAKVRAHLAAHKPSGGFGSGMVVVAFTLSSNGNIRSVRIVRSNGAASLKQAVLNSVHRAAPFPQTPDSARSADRRFVVPFLFQ